MSEKKTEAIEFLVTIHNTHIAWLTIKCYVLNIVVIVFNVWFLRRLHSIAIKNVQPLYSIHTLFKQTDFLKLAASIGDQEIEEP